MTTVYIESNFVLEVVLEQEEHEACVRLLSMRAIDLAIPAFALIEPDQTLQRHREKRTQLARDLEGDLKYLERTKSLATDVSNLKSVFAKSAQATATRYADVRKRLQHRARLLPLDEKCWRKAEALHAEGMRLPDAIVLAAVFADRRRSRSHACFLNRNAKDFAPFKQRLERANCRLIANFRDGVRYLESVRNR